MRVRHYLDMSSWGRYVLGQVSQSKTNGIPHLVTELAIAYYALDVQVDVVRLDMFITLLRNFAKLRIRCNQRVYFIYTQLKSYLIGVREQSKPQRVGPALGNAFRKVCSL